MERISLESSVNRFVEERKSYYKQWVFDEPIFISEAHHNNLIRLQKIMQKMIRHFVMNYDQFKHLMPVSQQVELLLEKLKGKDYRIGTYRTDFVYDDQKQVKLIEITARFGLNGMFLSAIIQQIADDFHQAHLANCEMIPQHDGIYGHISEYLKGAKQVHVLKGKDIRNESKIYRPIFEGMGLPVIDVPYEEIGSYLESMRDSWIVSELALEEILEIPETLIDQLITLKVFNDFRTIFLIHDKRFFAVMGDEEFRRSSLTENEIDFFDGFYIPTFTALQGKEYWSEARENKDEWIIKHRSLGKSQKVYAGIVTEQETWNRLFEDEDFENLVLQKWIPQTRIKGSIDNQEFDDFVTGTLIYFDDHYFGLGDFRTSSFPVTNKKDHRKAVSLVLKQGSEEKVPVMQNFIP